jgi:hypothetical protein
MAQRHLDRYDNLSSRPWPASPFVYPLDGRPRTHWPTVARVLVFGSIMLAGVIAIILGVASYVTR